jgi:glycosyltransferase involved in cell wall biosynthesis
MRILQVHNFYVYPGGEDAVVATEYEMLRARGHELVQLHEHNARIASSNQLAVAARTFWSRESRARVAREIERFKPDVCHFHNTFPLISPSAYQACHDAGVPVVQTLHNYRLVCPSPYLWRSGHACYDCLGRRTAWPAVLHRCYHGSATTTAVIAGMNAVHSALGTWTSRVDAYITPSHAAKRLLVRGGLPADMIHVKPNMVEPDPGVGEHRGDFALFVGRLSPEKGLATLLDAWAAGDGPMPLMIVGQGPDADLAKRNVKGVQWLGHLPKEHVFELMKEAAVLVFPSEWDETFGLAVAEAFAAGLPVIASRIGAALDLITDQETGLLFDTGDAGDLLEKVVWARDNRQKLVIMAARARRIYEEQFTAAGNYPMLMNIYRQASEISERRRTVRS